MTKPKILILDIETSPNLVYSWGLSVPGGYLSSENIVRERNVLSIACKWYKQSGIWVNGVKPEHPTHDRELLESFIPMFQEADAVVAHNGDWFDIPWLRTRCLYWGLDIPPNIIQIDTRQIAKKVFKFNSNKLEYLATFLKIGHKVKTDFDLWKRCMEKDPKAHKQMKVYNMRDTQLLEKVFRVLLPHIPAKLNHQLFLQSSVCESCGSYRITKRGVAYTRHNKYQRYQCQVCFHWFRGRKPIKD